MTVWTLPEQLARRPRDPRTQIARSGKIGLARLALAAAAGDGGRTIRRAADDLLAVHLALEAIVQPDNGQAEMQQIGDDRKERRFLPAMLAAGRHEGRADLAVHPAGRPQAARTIEEGRH